MCPEVVIEVDSADLPVSEVFDLHVKTMIEAEPLVATATHPFPYLRIWGEHRQLVGENRRSHEAIGCITLLHERKRHNTYWLDWRADPIPFLGELKAVNGVIVEGIGNADHWRFTLRFPDADALTEFHETIRRRGFSFTIRKVTKSGRSITPHGLTPEQYEALTLAFERGYFAVPRQIDLIELATELDISDTAVSQRLRRGMQVLLRESFKNSSVESFSLDEG